MLPPHLEMIGAKTAGRIWAFLSKFVMLDRFCVVFGAAEVLPGLEVPRKICSLDYLGTGAKVTCSPAVYNVFNNGLQILEEVTPPTKVTRRFLTSWRDRDVTSSNSAPNLPTQPSFDKQDTAGIALTMSKRLIVLMKRKRVLNIESGLETIAFGMIICSMVRTFHCVLE